jgi:hypothetical protein
VHTNPMVLHGIGVGVRFECSFIDYGLYLCLSRVALRTPRLSTLGERIKIAQSDVSRKLKT